MGETETRAVGRPREFDVDVALEQAMQVFWERGYEGASLTELTGAMGITKTSMYAAFGNKEQLFRKALQRYGNGPAAYASTALEQPTARAVVEGYLRGSARTSTLPADFSGCLTVQGALADSPGSSAAHELLVDWRTSSEGRLAARLQRAIDEGDLPAHADPEHLARYVMTLGYGIAVQAANGVGRDELERIADTAMLAWPPLP